MRVGLRRSLQRAHQLAALTRDRPPLSNRETSRAAFGCRGSISRAGRRSARSVNTKPRRMNRTVKPTARSIARSRAFLVLLPVAGAVILLAGHAGGIFAADVQLASTDSETE